MIGLLVFGLVVLSTICLWLLIEQRKSWKFLILFIPILLILVTSTYFTYTSLLGFPKLSTPEKGLYLKHHIDEPDWIYLWVLTKKNVPMSYQIVYSRETHNSLEGVKGKADEGKFMVLGEDAGGQRGNFGLEDDGSNRAGGGFSIGGDISFYEWDYANEMAPKDTQQ